MINQPNPRVSSLRLYDAIDRFRPQVFGDHVHHGLWMRGDESPADAMRALVQYIAKQAAVTQGTEICDVGSGYGGTANLLASDYGARVTGYVDSVPQYEYAAQNARPEVRFVLGDWLENRLPPESFDRILAIESSEHFSNKLDFFREAARLLKPGGRLVVATWLTCERADRIAPAFFLPILCSLNGFPSLGSFSEYQQFFTDFGFELESAEDLSLQVRRTWPVSLAQAFARLKTAEGRALATHHRAEALVLIANSLIIWSSYLTKMLRYGLFVARKR